MYRTKRDKSGEALANGKRQQGIMDDVMNTENIENIWDSEQIEKMILERI